MKQSDDSSWSIDNAATEYGIDRWGDGYFGINESGNVQVSPHGKRSTAVDLKRLVDQLECDGLTPPVLIRFNGILSHRIEQLNDCFHEAIDEHEYQNRYRCVFPIKVNQQRDVVKQIASEGEKNGFGIEAGSKPELIAAAAMTDPSTPIICNGFKDQEYIRLALMIQQLGRTVFLVIEKSTELDLVLRIASELDVRPTIGMRVKLATRASGRWKASGGYRSKFGLTVAEVLGCLDRLLDSSMADCFKMLHFHIGSQVGSIQHVKAAIIEASRIYVDLKRGGAAMGYLDLGGGLGVDYDGTQSDSPSSINYSMQEYANDVVHHVQSVCDEAGVDHPELLTESGRAISAQHSVLVIETLGVSQQGSPQGDLFPELHGEGDLEAMDALVASYEKPVQDLWYAHQSLSASNMMESFHDAQAALDLSMNLFSGGYLPLRQRVAAENLYFSICRRVRDLAVDLPEAPGELQHLDRLLSDTYFVNFSLFQSLPDSWAIGQLFPIMPIHRLNEAPTRPAVLGDITCDSDGKVDSFVCGSGVEKTIKLHEHSADHRYLLGVFMVGAYQEILGDLHNLFGDTHAVHVDCRSNQFGAAEIDIHSIVRGDTIAEVLQYVQYKPNQLIEQFQKAIDQSVSSRRISQRQADETRDELINALTGYTYLNTTSPESDSAKNSPARGEPVNLRAVSQDGDTNQARASL